jgi:hypothetical protein
MKIGVPSADPNAITSDLALVTALRSADPGAMAALYDRYSSIVYSVALRVYAIDFITDDGMHLSGIANHRKCDRHGAWDGVVFRHPP